MSTEFCTAYLFHISASEPHILSLVKSKNLHTHLLRRILCEKKFPPKNHIKTEEGATIVYETLTFSSAADLDAAKKVFKFASGSADWHSQQYNVAYMWSQKDLEESD